LINWELHDARTAIGRCRTEYNEVEASIEQALSLCADGYALCVAAPADIRRMPNQAVYTELRVRDEAIVEGVLMVSRLCSSTS